MDAFCTIITPDYFPFAQALLESLIKHSNKHVKLQVLISVDFLDTSFFRSIENENLQFTFIYEIKYPIAKQLFEKYNSQNMDAYRWSMKPVFINYLLNEKKFEKIIFVDPDLFFFGNPQFLFDLLDEHRVILTPHWRCAEEPMLDFHNFKLNFKDGIFNGGFIGARNDAVEVMSFWAKLCLAACEVNRPEGLFVDQKYLDILHSRFEGIGVVRHRGCNVSNWNITDCQRTISSNGEIIINGIYPIVFIHFTPSLMRGVLSGVDINLYNHFMIYSKAVKKCNPSIDLLFKTKTQLDELEKKEKLLIKKQNSIFSKIRRRLKLRTRVYSLFSIKLYEKIRHGI